MGIREGVSVSTADKLTVESDYLFTGQKQVATASSQGIGKICPFQVSFTLRLQTGSPSVSACWVRFQRPESHRMGSWWVDSGASVTSVERPRSQPFSSTSVTCLEARAPASQRGTLTTATPSTRKGATCSLVTEVHAGLCHRLHMSPAPSNSYVKHLVPNMWQY